MYSLGFRSNVGTQGAIATVVSHITRGDAFRQKHSAALVLIDVEKAFEMVSSTVVLQVLAKAGIVGNLLNWIESFLTERRGRVQFQNELSSSMDFKNGTPQGSCLSPTIFSYVIICLLDQKLPASVQLVAYVDDLALSCVHTNKEKLITDLQSALNLLHVEAMNYGLQFSPIKSKAMWFYTKRPEQQITLNEQVLPWSSNEKYLGIQLDSNMTFTYQANCVAAQAKKRT